MITGEKMHEQAYAEAIVREIEELDRAKITIIIGELQNIDIDALRQYIDFYLRKQKRNIEYKVEKTLIKCNKCNNVFGLEKTVIGEEEKELIHFIPEAIHSFIRCPQCSSRDIDVIRGRGIRILVE